MEVPSWDFEGCVFAGRIYCLSFATCAMWRPKVAAKNPAVAQVRALLAIHILLQLNSLSSTYCILPHHPCSYP